MKFRITYTGNKAIEYECDEIVDIEMLEDTTNDPHEKLLDKTLQEVIPLDTSMDARALELFGSMPLREFLQNSPGRLLIAHRIAKHSVRHIVKHLSQLGFIPGCTARVIIHRSYMMGET